MIGNFFARLLRKMVPALKALLSRFASPIVRVNDPSSTMPLRSYCLTNSLPRCPDRFFDIFALLLSYVIPPRIFPLNPRSQMNYFLDTSNKKKTCPSVATLPVTLQCTRNSSILTMTLLLLATGSLRILTKKAHTRVDPSRQIGSAFPPL